MKMAKCVNGTVSVSIIFLMKTNLIFESLKVKQFETKSLTVKQRLTLIANVSFDVLEDGLSVGIH
jgi:hypothetical protein